MTEKFMRNKTIIDMKPIFQDCVDYINKQYENKNSFVFKENIFKDMKFDKEELTWFDNNDCKYTISVPQIKIYFTLLEKKEFIKSVQIEQQVPTYGEWEDPIVNLSLSHLQHSMVICGIILMGLERGTEEFYFNSSWEEYYAEEKGEK